MSLDPEIQIGEALPLLESKELIQAYSGLLCLSENIEERDKIMREFEESCHGALALVYAVDQKERSVATEKGEAIAPAEEFMPQAYGILMCLLTLQNASRLKRTGVTL